MKLLYVWIDNYKSISKQGFNLSSEYNFSFDQENKILNFEKNKSYIKNFFSINNNTNSNVIEITALVGENGSGKSSIFEILKYQNFNENSSNIIVYSLKDNQDIIYYSGLKLKNTESLTYKEYQDNLFENLSIIYSNHLYRPIDESYLDRINKSGKITNYLKDISTNSVLNMDSSKPSKFDTYYPLDKYIQFNFFGEISRKIKLLNQDKNFFSTYFSLESPSHLRIKIKNYAPLVGIYLDSIIKGNEPEIRDIKSIILEYYNNISTKLNNLIDTCKSNKDKFILNFHNQLIAKNIMDYEYATDYYKKNYPYILEEYLESLDNYLTDKNDAQIGNIINFIINPKIRYNLESYLRINNYKYYPFYEDFLTSLKIENINCISKSEIVIKFDLFEEHFDDLDFFIYTKESFDLYFSTGLKKESELNSDIIYLSSGEETILSFFSRLNEVLLYYKTKENILLLIDEVELTFHPNWQRKFIYNLIRFLESIPKKCSIQIIIASHSPFIISDLPNSNIIFMEKNNILDKTNKTFADNIYSLFKDTFFLENFVGEFASEKLDNLISDLNSDKRIESNRLNDINKIIDYIGEPILRNKLRIMYEKRKEISLDNKILELEKQLEELRKEKNDQN